MGFLKKVLREATKPLAHTPLRPVHQIAREIGRVGDQVVGTVAEGGAHLVENAARETVKGTSKVIGEVTGSRRRVNQQADAQNQALRQQVISFLNSQQDAEIQALDQQLHLALQAYAQEHQQIAQEILNIDETIAIYRQWRTAMVEIESNQAPTTLNAILGGDVEVLKNFLMEGEFRGSYNPLTLALKKFLSGTLQPATFSSLVDGAFNRLSEASDLFYLEQDFRGNTFAE